MCGEAWPHRKIALFLSRLRRRQGRSPAQYWRCNRKGRAFPHIGAAEPQGRSAPHFPNLTQGEPNEIKIQDQTPRIRLGGGGSSGDGPALFVAALALGLYVAARLYRLTASCLWFDEIFGVHAARHDWAGLLSFVAADLIHPPLFYALLKLWVAAAGESLIALRLFAAAAAVAATVPFILLCRELKLGPWATNLALLLLAANGFLVKYAQELRMYSLLLLLTCCSLWLFVRSFNSLGGARKTRAALFAVNLLLVYTHYYGWFVVGAEASFLLLRGRDRLRPFLLGCAALAACFVPWVFAVARAQSGAGLGQNIGWVERPGALEVLRFLTLLNEPFYFRQSTDEPLVALWGAPLGLVLCGLPLAPLLVRAWRRRKDDVARTNAVLFLLCATLLPLAFAFAASWVLPYSVWGSRHLIVVFAPYLILVALSLESLPRRWLRNLFLSLLAVWFLLAGVVLLSRPRGTYIWCTWEGLAEGMRREEQSGGDPVRVYAFEDLVAYHLWFALDTAGEGRRFAVTSVKGVPGLTEDAAYFIPRGFDGVAPGDLSAVRGEHFWAAFRDAEWDERRPPLKILLTQGYRAEKIYEAGAQGQRAFLVRFVRDLPPGNRTQ